MELFWIVCAVLLYATIGSIFAAYMASFLSGERSPTDPMLKSVYPWEVKEVVFWRGLLWPIFITIELYGVPGKYFARLGTYLGERQLMRQKKLLQKRIHMEQEQEKVRIQLRELEQQAAQEVEACCQSEKQVRSTT